MDFLDGIDPEGVAMDDGDIAREARVRAAYMDWCKEYKKESDEVRFKQFFKNFLEMEEFSKDTGKEMVLNEFADYTEAEYTAMQNGETVPAVEEPVAEETIVEEPVVDETSKAEEEAAAKAAEEAAAAKAAEEAAAKAAADKAAEEAAAKKAAEEAAAKAAAEKEAAAAKKLAEEKAEASKLVFLLESKL